MDDPEFLNSLVSTYGEEDPAPTPPPAGPNLHDRLTSALERGAEEELSALVAAIDASIDHFRALTGPIHPFQEDARVILELLEAYRGQVMDRNPSLQTFHSLQSQHDRLNSVVEEELKQLDVRPAYSPWVDHLRGLLQAYIRGRLARDEIFAETGRLLQELESQRLRHRAVKKKYLDQIGANAPKPARDMLELMSQGYEGGVVALKGLETALAARDVPAIGQRLRDLNQAFARLAQAKQCADEAAEGQRFI